MRASLPGLLLMLLLGAAACDEEGAGMNPLPTVSHVEITRYLGTWYEIARYPNRFQQNCFGATADYRLRPDGDLQVRNTCHEGRKDGKQKSVVGKAWVVDRTTNAKLKVRFFWPFSGNYWILELGPSYEYVVVGEPGRKYLWILSRTPALDEATYQAILGRLPGMGYDPARLTRDPR